MASEMQTQALLKTTEMKGTGALTDARVVFAYLTCLVATGAMFFFVAQQEFPSVLTMANFAQCLSFVLVVLHIHSTQSVAGISGKTMILSAVALVFKLASTLFLDGYLPLDKSGDMVYQIADTCSLLALLKVIHSVYKAHRETYDEQRDSVSARTLFIVCVALGVAVHPPLNYWATFDISWAVFLYLESMALVPQLVLCSKSGMVPSYTAHYLALTVVKICLGSWFWYYGVENIASFQEEDGVKGFCWSGAAIVAALALQVVLLVGFAGYYGKAWANGAIGKSAPVGEEQVQMYVL